MTRHRLYETATSMHHFVMNFHNDLRESAPPSDVRIFRQLPDGTEQFIGTQPNINYEQALELSHQNFNRFTKRNK